MQEIQSETETPTKISTLGKALVGITGGFAFALTLICAPFVVPALRKHCLPYIPATTEQIVNIFKALRDRRGNLLDIGSGDGRIVLEGAKRDFQSHGVELNPWLVVYSNVSAFRSGLFQKTKFFCRDLWKFNVEPYDNVVIFGVEQMMGDLEKKFLCECRSGTHVVACRFPLPTLKPVKTLGVGIDMVWVYVVNREC